MKRWWLTRKTPAQFGVSDKERKEHNYKVIKIDDDATVHYSTDDSDDLSLNMYSNARSFPTLWKYVAGGSDIKISVDDDNITSASIAYYFSDSVSKEYTISGDTSKQIYVPDSTDYNIKEHETLGEEFIQIESLEPTGALIFITFTLNETGQSITYKFYK